MTVAQRSASPVTVLMAVHNGLPFVRAAIESILAQEGVDLTFLILDDGSTDGTPDYLHSLTDPRVRLVRYAVNMGLTRALNQGLALCETPCVARMDADDLSLPGRLAAQAAFLDEHPDVLLVGCGYAWVDEQGRILQTITPPLEHDAIWAAMRTANVFAHGAVMFRREAVLALGGYREGFRDSQDYDLWLRLGERGPLASLPDVLYHLRRHSGTKSTLLWPRLMAFRDLARDLAALRAEGRDDTATYEAETAAILARYPSEALDGRERRRLLAGHQRSIGVHHLRQRRWGTGLHLIAGALLRDPLEPGFWRGLRSGLARLLRILHLLPQNGKN